jgi:SapB morphogen precursor RamS
MALLDLQGLTMIATSDSPTSVFSFLLCCNSDLSVLLCGCN